MLDLVPGCHKVNWPLVDYFVGRKERLGEGRIDLGKGNGIDSESSLSV